MGLIEIHPRTFTRNRGSTPTAERRFLETPDVATVEALPALGSVHPEYAALTCVNLTKSTGHGGDPEQTLYTAKYENVVR